MLHSNDEKLRKTEAELKKKTLLLKKCVGTFVFKMANNQDFLIQNNKNASINYMISYIIT